VGIEMQLAEDRFDGVEDRFKRYMTGVKFVSDQERTLSSLRQRKSATEAHRAGLQTKIAQITRDLNDYLANEEAIQTNAKIDEKIAELNNAKTIRTNMLRASQSELQRAQTQIALLSQRRDDMLKRISEAEELEFKYEAYEAYLAAICRDGLPYKLIADVLPAIQTAVNEILAQIVEFTLLFETDGKNINMRIRYDDERIWPSELASGMEKFLISMAIRVALSSLSSLPKSNFLIVDEGFGTLDPDMMASVHMMFDVLRTKFDFLLLISHIDALKDVPDMLADIKRDNGFSQIQVK
jgi:DNA repair exonuclease SbcCD ATPase subunit